MKRIINFHQAVIASLFLTGLLILFHLAILIGILFFEYAPIESLWGGQMKTAEQLFRFEIVSFLVSCVVFFLVLIKAKRLNMNRFVGLANISMWVLFVLFLLNTFGNLMAKSNFEKFFAIFTGLLAFLLLRVALEKKVKERS